MNKTPAIGSFMDACIHEFTERVCVLGYSRDKKRCHVAISPQDNKSMNGVTEWIDTSSLVLPSFPEAIMYAQVTEVSSWSHGLPHIGLADSRQSIGAWHLQTLCSEARHGCVSRRKGSSDLQPVPGGDILDWVRSAAAVHTRTRGDDGPSAPSSG